MIAYSFIRGATISLALENLDDAAVDTVEATLKLRDPDLSPAAGTPAAEFTVTPADPVAVGRGAGWLFTLSPEDSETLSPGNYLAEARLTIGDLVVITDRLAVTIKE